MRTRMLCYKAWLDTRSRFVVGMVIIVLATCGVVLSYPRALAVIAAVDDTPTAIFGSGPLSDRIADAIALGRTYRGYVFSQLYRSELPQLWSLFAMVLGTGGLLSQSVRGEGHYLLSLPASRQHIVVTRAAVTLLELLVLAVTPVVVLPILSPAIGQSYSIADALVHAGLLFGGGVVFFSFTYLMSSLFSDVWRPPLLTATLFVVIAVLRMLNPAIERFTMAPVITGASFFASGGIPWAPLTIGLALSMVMLSMSVRNVARRDF